LLFFEVLTIPVKLVLVAAPLFFLPKLSAFLHQRHRVAIGLYVSLVALTLCAILAYLPLRPLFTDHFSSEVYRWYSVDMPASGKDFLKWKVAWAKYIPHMIEASLLFLYYAVLIAACSIWRLRAISGMVVAMVCYLMLILVPLFTDLIEWNYDVFLKGIVFDSISMALFPLFWFAGDYSIFFYGFMFIYFSVCSVFFYASPRHNG
jgi:hypothetical protein